MARTPAVGGLIGVSLAFPLAVTTLGAPPVARFDVPAPASLDRPCVPPGFLAGPPSGDLRGPGVPQILRFVPVAANYGRDAFCGLFADDDRAPGSIIDYRCGPDTYDGHGGSDLEVPSFSEVDLGVPIFAAADGTVIYRADGDPNDHNRQPGTSDGN